ncbi:MAG: hypothetical protein ACREAA_14245 [Candidatus Polarisedimenticolia bacterium]
MHTPLLIALSFPLLLASQTPVDLSLQVSTHSGRVPLLLTVKGDLKGITEGTTCLLRIDRVYTSPAGIRYDERKEQPCTATPEALVESPAFKKDLELKELGDYSIRIILKPEGEREMAGTTQEVKVYYSLEMGAQGSHTP